MRKTLLLGGALLGLAGPALRAGSVMTLADSPEADGKLSVKGDAVHVDSSSPTDVPLSTILQANYSDSFLLNYFNSAGDTATQLPPGWKGQDEGTAKSPGTVSYAQGVFTLSSTGRETKPNEEETNCYFAGLPWTGDGEWTARISAIGPALPNADAGLMLRAGPDSGAAENSLGATADANSHDFDGPGVRFLSSESPLRIDINPAVSVQLPVWLRLTRSGANLEGAISEDGENWQLLYENMTKIGSDTWAGLFVGSHPKPHPVAPAQAPIPGVGVAGGAPAAAPAPAPAPVVATGDELDEGTTPGTATIDQVLFTPGPCSTRVLPAGVVLQGGSFLAGEFDRVSFDPATSDGLFHRTGEAAPGRPTSIPSSKIAIVTLHPVDRSRIAQAADQAGLIMKNGDLLVSETQEIDRSGVTANSLLLGIVPYRPSEVLACIVHPLQTQPSPYEIRLTDGSDILASGLTANKDQVMITDISGFSISVGQDQIAQVRAGAAQVQDLVDLPWQVEAPPAAAKPTPAPGIAATTPAPPEVTPEARNAAVQCWQGTSQEHIMVLPAATPVDFPLTGKFHEVALSIVLLPGSAPNTAAVVRIFADGNEAARTPAIKVGDAPRFTEVNVRDPKTLSIVADSAPGTKVLLIDPVALRDN